MSKHHHRDNCGNQQAEAKWREEPSAADEILEAATEEPSQFVVATAPTPEKSRRFAS